MVYQIFLQLFSSAENNVDVLKISLSNQTQTVILVNLQQGAVLYQY